MSQIIIPPDEGKQQSPYALDVHLHESLPIGPDEAKRRVKRNLIPELGTGLTVQEPELLVQDEQIAWRVPIVLSLPQVGTLGVVGAVLIDARSGHILLTEKAKQDVIDHAHRLYRGSVL